MPAHILVVATALLLTACERWYTPVEVVLPQCGSETRFELGTGTQPTLTWTEDCSIGGVIVLVTSDSMSPASWVWERKRAPRGFSSPMVIGESFTLRSREMDAVHLEPGRVHLLYVIQPRLQRGEWGIIAELQYTPPSP